MTNEERKQKLLDIITDRCEEFDVEEIIGLASRQNKPPVNGYKIYEPGDNFDLMIRFHKKYPWERGD